MSKLVTKQENHIGPFRAIKKVEKERVKIMNRIYPEGTYYEN